MHLLCLDVGNTHLHYGVVTPTAVLATGHLLSASLDDPVTGLAPLLQPLLATGDTNATTANKANATTDDTDASTTYDSSAHAFTAASASVPASTTSASPSSTSAPTPTAAASTGPTHPFPSLPGPIAGIAFCSVVPALVPRLRALLSRITTLPVFQLTHQVQLGLPLSYPQPAEIGHDRLANAAAAHALAPGRPVVVIDLGTAVTFDLITPDGGYEGGIITPGPALVTRYLHERTAQLPWVTDLTTPVHSVIGKSTVEAIRIGAVVGYAGLIQTLLDAVLAEFAARGLPPAEIILSGGAAAVVAGRLRQPARNLPDLTLQGLAVAWHLNAPDAP